MSKTKVTMRSEWFDRLKTVTNKHGCAMFFIECPLENGSATFSIKVHDGSKRQLSACVSQMSKQKSEVSEFWEGVRSIAGVNVMEPRDSCHFGQATATSTTIASTIELVTYLHSKISPCENTRDKNIMSAFMGQLGEKPTTKPINEWRPNTHEQHTRSMRKAVRCMIFIAKSKVKKEDDGSLSASVIKQSI